MLPNAVRAGKNDGNVKKNLDLLFPQRDREAWLSAGRSVQYLLARHPASQSRLEQSAGKIHSLYDRLFPLLDELCQGTCMHCPSPCCLTAMIWYDLKDILFLHLSGAEIPPAQPLNGDGDSCRYLGLKGCTLPRHSRPFICTFYICPPQMARLRRNEEKHRPFNDIISQLKIRRQALEEDFINITTG